MSGAVVRAQNVGKVYQTARGPLSILEWLARGARHVSRGSVEALREISFEVGSGEAVGVIGRNGAGKTTLLRILAGIVRPSSGSVEVRGRTRAVLDLQSLFVPLMSGRENIEFAMRLYGIPREQRRRVAEEVIAFSELGAVIDHPLRSYSSGMMLRLGFSLATAATPEVLLLDEVLVVGDEAFQKKCFERVRQLISQGVSVVFASHDLYRVEKLCERALWVDAGRVVGDGPSPAVIEAYQRGMEEDLRERVDDAGLRQWVYHRAGANPFLVENLSCGRDGEATSSFTTGDSFKLSFDVLVQAELTELHVLMFLHRDDATLVAQDVIGKPLSGIAAGERVRVRLDVPQLMLGPGRYFLSIALAEREGDTVAPYYDFERQRVSFVVDNSGRDVRFRRGVVHLGGAWDFEVKP